jgi:sugar phosphate permease
MLGVAEGGVWPAVLVMLSHWFPRAERARANALWMLCLPVSVVVSSPISGWIIDHWNWRLMLIAEGVLPFLWLVIWLAFIYDHPKDAKWISPEEKTEVETILEREASDLEPAKTAPLLKTLLNPTVLSLILIYFLANFGSYAYNGWLPSALKKTLDARASAAAVSAGNAASAGEKQTNLKIASLNAIPYAIAAFAMVLVARRSDRTRKRRIHIVNGMIWGGCFMALYVIANESYPVLAFAFVALVIAGPWSMLAPFWTIPGETLPRNVAATSMGLINAVGNLGGYFGPFVVGYIRQHSKNPDDYYSAFMVLALSLVLGGLAALLLPNEPRSPTPPTPRSAAK